MLPCFVKKTIPNGDDFEMCGDVWFSPVSVCFLVLIEQVEIIAEG